MNGIRSAFYALPFALLAATLPAAATQSPPITKPAFEVSSVRPVTGGNTELDRGGIRITPTGVVATRIPLIALIQVAYNLKSFQIPDVPDWVRSERYDVQGRTAQATDDSSIRAMLRTLLEERFTLKLRREMKPLAIYALEVVRTSERLREVKSEETPQARISMVPNGAEMFMRLTGEQTTMSQVSDVLTAVLQASERPVIDRTGLSGRYTFTLDWAPEPPPGAGATGAASLPSGPTLQTAIREQLGLRLTEEKGPIDVFAIESVGRPTEN